MELLAFIMFLLAGLGFGYALEGNLAWIALTFPVALALGAATRDGVTGEVVLRLVLAVAITAAGILAGRWLRVRGERASGGREPEPA
jgi:hypothetical protein